MEEIQFKDWLTNLDTKKQFSDLEIAHLYFHNGMRVREIAELSSKSIGELYRIFHQHGRPNRLISNHENVILFKNSGLSSKKIAEFTGYTPRNVNYILKKEKVKQHGFSE